MTTLIRKVRDADLAAVVEIDKTLFGPESFPSFSMRHFMNLFPESFFVAERDSVLIGYAAIGVNAFSHDAWLLSAGVLTPHQNQGIGKKLLTACDEYCQNAPVDICRLTTDPDNEGAIRFYERFGFRPESELRDYYDTGDHKMMMIKNYDDKSAN